MKKYETPEVNTLNLVVADIIQISEEEPQETPEALGRRGFNIGSVDASNINLFD